MRHINDELINDTHTYNGDRGRGGGGKRGSNLRRHCKISIGVKGELRKEDEGEEGSYIYIQHLLTPYPTTHKVLPLREKKIDI